MAKGKTGGQFFKTVYQGELEFDEEKFLLEVNSQFESPKVRSEVKWRLDVLKEIAARDELGDVCDGLRSELSRVFSTYVNEEDILDELKSITEITRDDGEVIDLRRFRSRARRTLSGDEYRVYLRRKIDNTNYQIKNLTMFYPEAQQLLTDLHEVTEDLIFQIDDPTYSVTKLKKTEDDVRNLDAFHQYESMKDRFLVDWLARFTKTTEAEAAKLDRKQIQELIVETQRYQLTQLIKSEIVMSGMDMNQYLGLHDTLEATFQESDFWERSNEAARNGFKNWILVVIQAFGMIKGKRYVLFQRKEEKDQMLLFGLGFPSTSDSESGEADEDMEADNSLALVPYIKPFTRKSGYLLEIRKRDLGDVEEYHQALRHALMPFLFAFDGMNEFELSSDLMSFFTSTY